MRIQTKYREEQNHLLQLLKRDSFEKRDVTLASGQKSNFYLDCKQVSFRGEGQLLIGRLFYELMLNLEAEGKKFAACGGMALGAVPLACATSMTAIMQGRELPTIAARKEAKGHGTGSFLEGALTVKAPATILMVEDVITTGGSTILAAQRFRERGYEVSDVLVLVDRCAGGESNLAAQGLRCQSLFDLRDFEEVLS